MNCKVKWYVHSMCVNCTLYYFQIISRVVFKYSSSSSYLYRTKQVYIVLSFKTFVFYLFILNFKKNHKLKKIHKQMSHPDL